MQTVRLALLLGCAGLGQRGEAWAQNVVSVRDTSSAAGAADVVLPIDLTVDQDLSLLRFDVTFDPAFCSVLVDPAGITVRKAGRTVKDPEEQPIDCSSGRIQIAVLDLLGGTVIPAGMGEILEVDVGALKMDAVGVFTFTVVDIMANHGPATVSVSGEPGSLTISPGATTSTSTSTTSTTSATSTSTSQPLTTSSITSSTQAGGTTTSTSSSSSTTRPSSTTTTSTSSSTLPPAESEDVCTDCVDNDGDGLVDYEDAACCADVATMRILRARLLAGRGGLQNGRLRIRAILAESGHAEIDPTREDVTIQLRSGSEERLCAPIGHELWLTRPSRIFAFHDPGPVGQGLARGVIRVRRRGRVEFQTASPRIDLSRYGTGELEITVRMGGLCSRGTVTLRARGAKGFVFP